MAHWSARQILVFVLAVLVTAGLSLSVVQAATAMPEATHMSMMTGMSGSGDHGCKHCGDTAGGKAMVCSPICATPLSVNLETESQPLIGQRQGFAALEHWLTGRSPPPDPYPPRPFHIV
jgi:hypothetical protein